VRSPSLGTLERAFLLVEQLALHARDRGVERGAVIDGLCLGYVDPARGTWTSISTPASHGLR